MMMMSIFAKHCPNIKLLYNCTVLIYVYVGVHIILPIAGYVDIVIVDSINRVDSHTDSGSVTGDCCTICHV